MQTIVHDQSRCAQQAGRTYYQALKTNVDRAGTPADEAGDIEGYACQEEHETEIAPYGSLVNGYSQDGTDSEKPGQKIAWDRTR
jgi:hypothetical protein